MAKKFEAKVLSNNLFIRQSRSKQNYQSQHDRQRSKTDMVLQEEVYKRYFFIILYNLKQS